MNIVRMRNVFMRVIAVQINSSVGGIYDECRLYTIFLHKRLYAYGYVRLIFSKKCKNPLKYRAPNCVKMKIVSFLTVRNVYVYLLHVRVIRINVQMTNAPHKCTGSNIGMTV